MLPFFLAALLLGLPSTCTAQTGSDTTSVRAAFVPDHSPRKALWRAAVLPGWGQWYNRQYLKIPLVYGGLAGMTAGALYMNHRYLRYRHAYLYKANADLVAQGTIDENPWPQYEDAYRALTRTLAGGRDISASVLRNQRDDLRRNRDLFYFGIGLWYGLTVLDAYVSAHLLDFDVSDDLTFAVRPHPSSGWTASLRWSI